MSETDWRPWLPEVIGALVVLAIGFTEAAVIAATTGGSPFGFVQALFVALAVGMSRRAPGAALGLVWELGLVHVLFGAPIMLTEFAVTAVFFGGARWGRPPTVVAGALSVPLAVLVAFGPYGGRSVSLRLVLGGSRLADLAREEPAVQLALSLIGLLIVAAPWLAGLVMRLLDRARLSRAEMLAAEDAAAHAREIAHLSDQQTRLARDVHDVVGHSLAVILAQAESGQYLDDAARLKTTMQTIATSARSSLQEVRQVLTSTMAPDDPGQFDSLIAGVRAGGHEIITTEQGTPRQLPRETAAVAHRVFQEMLTNAIKHGRRDQPITIERHWRTDTLRIAMTNHSGTGGANPGLGLDGMRRRLAAIGGHLDVQPGATTFTVTAHLPVRGGK
ncbi:MAG: histidine kinase [Actinoplanes sp.]